MRRGTKALKQLHDLYKRAFHSDTLANKSLRKRSKKRRQHGRPRHGEPRRESEDYEATFNNERLAPDTTVAERAHWQKQHTTSHREYANSLRSPICVVRSSNAAVQLISGRTTKLCERGTWPKVGCRVRSKHAYHVRSSNTRAK
jgi:hypothetical protein